MQIAGKPCHNGILPEHTFAIVRYEMILTLYLDKLHGFAKNLQRIEKLYALTDGDIGVYCTMQEQKRGIDLVGIEE